MLDIIIVFTCLSQYLAPTTLRQLRRVTEAIKFIPIKPSVAKA